MYDKGRRNTLLLFADLSVFLVNLPTRHSSTRHSSTCKQYPMRLELCKKIHIILLVVIKLLTLRIY